MQSYMKIKVLEYYNKLYKNPWFLVKKKCDKYHIINTVMNANQYIIYDVNLLFNIKKFIERSAGIIITLLINFYSRYN